MTRHMRVVLAFTICLFLSVGAYAATNLYSDKKTSETAAGHWTFTSLETARQLENVSIIAQTPATLTTTLSGRTFIIDGGGAGATGSTIVTVTLPPASSGKLYYKFISGDGSGISIRTSDSNFTGIYSDTFLYGSTYNGTQVIKVSPVTNTSIRLTQDGFGATGATIVVRSNAQGYWYVETQASPSTIVQDARLTNPQYKGYTY